jgi:ribosomal-protein-alanine N-acetyltransferase
MSPVLHTERLTLKLVERADQRKVFEGLSHPDIIRYYGVSYETYEATSRQMQFYEDHYKNGTGYLFKLLLNDTFIGVAGVYFINPQHRHAEMGYWLFPEYWKNGYATEAMKKIIAFSFEELHLHRLKADVETENPASSNLLKRLGFEKEGVMQDCEYKNGRYINLEIWALLNPKE